MDFLQQTYFSLISTRLIGVKSAGKNYNFRCPFCGDSNKNKHKKRGYLICDVDTYYKCHNCGVSYSFDKFLLELDNNLYNEYRIEKFKKELGHYDNKKNKEKIAKVLNTTNTQAKKIINNPLIHCKQLSKISINDDLYPVKEYCINRKIPEKYFDVIYACRNIHDISKMIPKYHDKDFMTDDMFMIVPFFKKDLSYEFIQCRTINKNSTGLRFITFEIENETTSNLNTIKLWGEQFIDWCKPIRILEGVIDAVFVENSLALAGASVNSAIEYIKMKQTQVLGKPNLKNIVFCLDKDYQWNIEIRKLLDKRIDDGYSVLIYDKRFIEKDINDMIVKQNWNEYKINDYITNRTFNVLIENL